MDQKEILREYVQRYHKEAGPVDPDTFDAIFETALAMSKTGISRDDIRNIVLDHLPKQRRPDIDYSHPY